MENVWRDDPVTDGQQGAIRFINANLGMNEHPRTKGEAADYINAYKEKAEAVKKERDQMKRERLEREKLCDPLIEQLQKPRVRKQVKTRKNPDESDMVRMDYERVKGLAITGGVRIEELNRVIGQSDSWLNYRAKHKDGMIPRSYVPTLAIALGVEEWDIAPELTPPAEPEQMEMALEDEPAVEVPENCVAFDAPGVRFKDREEAQEFATILQILGMTERDFTTMAFFTTFDRLRVLSVSALLQIRERRINKIVGEADDAD